MLCSILSFVVCIKQLVLLASLQPIGKDLKTLKVESWPTLGASVLPPATTVTSFLGLIPIPDLPTISFGPTWAWLNLATFPMGTITSQLMLLIEQVMVVPW